MRGQHRMEAQASEAFSQTWLWATFSANQAESEALQAFRALTTKWRRLKPSRRQGWAFTWLLFSKTKWGKGATQFTCVNKALHVQAPLHGWEVCDWSSCERIKLKGQVKDYPMSWHTRVHCGSYHKFISEQTVIHTSEKVLAQQGAPRVSLGRSPKLKRFQNRRLCPSQHYPSSFPSFPANMTNDQRHLGSQSGEGSKPQLLLLLNKAEWEERTQKRTQG